MLYDIEQRKIGQLRRNHQRHHDEDERCVLEAEVVLFPAHERSTVSVDERYLNMNQCRCRLDGVQKCREHLAVRQREAIAVQRAFFDRQPVERDLENLALALEGRCDHPHDRQQMEQRAITSRIAAYDRFTETRRVCFPFREVCLPPQSSPLMRLDARHLDARNAQNDNQEQCNRRARMRSATFLEVKPWSKISLIAVSVAPYGTAPRPAPAR